MSFPRIARAGPSRAEPTSEHRGHHRLGVGAAEARHHAEAGLAGIELRPVDQAAVMRLIRASKGQIEIPGITYRQVAKMSFRG